MPPLICPSPVILDQSFPRSEVELRTVAKAMGEIAERVQDGELDLLVTDALREFIGAFDCGIGQRPYALLTEIHGLLDQWILQPHAGIKTLDVSDIVDSVPHPIPASCTADGYVDYWADELGKVLVAHDAEAEPGTFFIGVACESAFSGGPTGAYLGPRVRALPLVGPLEASRLSDASEWEELADVHNRNVSVRDAAKHFKAIGATEVRAPTSGSHYKVLFPGRRPWPLDPNVDPIPDRFLRQLERITGYPANVIKTALITGDNPRRRHRLASRFGRR